MKFATLILASSLLSLTACSTPNKEAASNGETVFLQTSNPSFQGGTKVHNITNQQTGMVQFQIELPANWNLDQAQGLITGPNGLEIREYQGVSNVFTNDPYMQQAYAAQGKRMMQPLGTRGVLQQILQQQAGQMGLTFKNAFSVPSLAQKDREYGNQLVSYGNPQKNYDVLATEWVGNDGKKALILISYQESASMGMVFWYYQYKALSASAADYETAKAQYIRALESIRHNPAAIQAYNQKESSNIASRDRTFQQRQQAQNASFQATQRAHREASDAVFNSQKSIYETNSAAMDRTSQQFNNAIMDENTMYNPTNGETYQVQSGYDNYWMNSDGQYIGTDDYLYNPNTDQNINNTDWQQATSPY